MESPRWVPFEEVAGLRAGREVPETFTGLWVTGSLGSLALPSVAIVGTRAATAYGRAQALRFASQLCAAGCCIISGLALGIDAFAHEGALAAGGPTLGILGAGHERFFPKRNRPLAARMIDGGGAVISPFEPEREVRRGQFLQRNGIVAALADAVVVIEAPARSGALNTAGWAAGRVPVFAVPGDVDRAHAAGCHALIRDGAILARSPRDVIDDLRFHAQPSGTASKQHEVHIADPLQRTLLRLLDHGECPAEELLARSNASTAQCFAALSMLELQGAIESRPGNRYARC